VEDALRLRQGILVPAMGLRRQFRQIDGSRLFPGIRTISGTGQILPRSMSYQQP
jgi:hypothetical protein